MYNYNNTQFFSAKDLWNVTKLQTYTNTFNFSVVIYNVSIPAEYRQYFTVSTVTWVMIKFLVQLNLYIVVNEGSTEIWPLYTGILYIEDEAIWKLWDLDIKAKQSGL